VDHAVRGRLAFVLGQGRLPERRGLVSFERRQHAALVELGDLIDARKNVSPRNGSVWTIKPSKMSGAVSAAIRSTTPMRLPRRS